MGDLVSVQTLPACTGESQRWLWTERIYSSAEEQAEFSEADDSTEVTQFHGL